MRTDSPTGSLTMLSMVLCLATSRGTTLHSGDISAAFLQGSKLDRALILSLPKGGIPQVDQSEEEKFFVVSSTIYGTRDAPRGWFKNLDNTLKAEGFKPIPHEHAAYTLVEENGKLAGLLVAHVDDLIWTGGSFIEDKMNNVCQRYKFGKLQQDNFRFCGREINPEGHQGDVSQPDGPCSSHRHG